MGCKKNVFCEIEAYKVVDDVPTQWKPSEQ